MPVEPLEELLDTRRAAPLLGIRPHTLTIWRHKRRADQPRYLRIGRNIRYEPAELARWRASRETGPTTGA